MKQYLDPNGAIVLTEDGKQALARAFFQTSPPAILIQSLCFLWAEKLIAGGVHCDLMLQENRNKLIDAMRELERAANAENEQ